VHKTQRPDTMPALITDLSEARPAEQELMMRLYGQWSYHPIDLRNRVFPMDNTRCAVPPLHTTSLAPHSFWC
jgi:hypothetical protein